MKRPEIVVTRLLILGLVLGLLGASACVAVDLVQRVKVV